MNFLQKIRASHLNRHHYLDLFIGIVVFQFINVALIISFGSPENVPSTDSATPLMLFVVMAVFFAPYVENLLMIGFASLYEKLLGRTGLFIAIPLLMALLHFRSPQHLPFPIAIRLLELFGFFYIFLKQYDLHKPELGWHRALLLSSTLHFACNASGVLALYCVDMYIDAETIFSAQPGE
jgi:hypothetical protein